MTMNVAAVEIKLWKGTVPHGSIPEKPNVNPSESETYIHAAAFIENESVPQIPS